MPDFSYITRALLGLGSPTNFRYDGGFAVSVLSQNSAMGTETIDVGDPSHIFFSSTSVLSTELQMPGIVGGGGTLVDGLTYYVKNTRDKGTLPGDNYMINVNVSDPTGTKVIVKLYEQDGAHVVYNSSDSTWQLVSHLSTW
jgi:hypothetical protein